jgi:hypothetical protein
MRIQIIRFKRKIIKILRKYFLNLKKVLIKVNQVKITLQNKKVKNWITLFLKLKSRVYKISNLKARILLKILCF